MRLHPRSDGAGEAAPTPTLRDLRQRLQQHWEECVWAGRGRDGTVHRAKGAGLAKARRKPGAMQAAGDAGTEFTSPGSGAL